jgi:hypothetical protein
MGAMPNRRPRLELIAPAASPQEAAAVVAAVERFMRDTAPRLAPAQEPGEEWTRTARLEGVGREDEQPSTWGDPHPWGQRRAAVPNGRKSRTWPSGHGL